MKKRMLAILLVLFLLGGSAVAYGYWDNLSQEQNNVTLTVGEGVTLEVAVGDQMGANDVLVPAGVVLKANDVTSVALTYNVNLDQAVLSNLNLTVTASNVQINGSTTNAGLVNISVDAPATINSSTVVVTVTVTLTEPADAATYAAVYGQDITFDLDFVAAQ